MTGRAVFRRPLFHPNYGAVPVGPDRPGWVNVSTDLKLFNRETVIFIYIIIIIIIIIII